MTCYPYGRGRNLPVIVWLRGTKVNSYSTYYTASSWFTVFAMVIMLVAVGINPAMDESRRRVTRLLMVAQCLRDVYGMSGRIYRLGGDEFCVILTRNVDRIDQLNAAFACRLQNNRAQLPWLPDVSTGYAVFDTSEEELGSAVERADAAMYRVKNEKKAAARS